MTDSEAEIALAIRHGLEHVYARPGYHERLVSAMRTRGQRPRRKLRWAGGIACTALLATVSGVTADVVLRHNRPAANVVHERVIRGLPKSPGPLTGPGTVYVVTGPPPVEHDRVISSSQASGLADFRVLVLAGGEPVRAEYVTYSSPPAPSGWSIVAVPHIRLTYNVQSNSVVLFENAFDPTTHPGGVFVGPGTPGSKLVTHDLQQYVVQTSGSGAIDEVLFARGTTVVSVTFAVATPGPTAWSIIDRIN